MRKKYQKMICSLLVVLALMVSTIPATGGSENTVSPRCILEEIYVSQ